MAIELHKDNNKQKHNPKQLNISITSSLRSNKSPRFISVVLSTNDRIIKFLKNPKLVTKRERNPYMNVFDQS